MIVRFSRRASRDLDALLSYIAERSPNGAASVAASLLRGMQLIAENPGAGKRTDKSGVSVSILGDYPYKIFYRVRGEFVEIVRVRHGARRPWFG
jgi:plasmid stabilization system protein ParE